MNKDSKLFEELNEVVENSDMPEEDKRKIFLNISQIKEQRLNIMITGATGCGKSSTINALFGEEKAKVGCTPDPETMEIDKYDYKNLILWDTPGLGDGKDDIRHSKIIIDKLNELDSDGNLLIDLVLVILDGGTRDYGTTFQLINEVIIPNLGDEKNQRLLVAINQADKAMSEKHWDKIKNQPKPELIEFLDKKAESVKRRIKESTGVIIDPIYYSAGYKEVDEEQNPPYNLSKLLYYILKNTPKKKRLVLADNMNTDSEVWKSDDEIINYNEEIKKGFIESIIDGAEKGSDIGGKIGGVFGEVGEKFGEAVGGFVGGIFGAIGGIFSRWF